MALANFLDKAALGASQVLKDFDRTSFETILLQNVVEIGFDKNAAKNFESKTTLDLLIRLTARLYPTLSIKCMDDPNEPLVDQLKELALSINGQIDLSETASSTVRVIIGATKPQKRSVPTFFIGSAGWIVKFSIKKPISSGNSQNSFGAGAAACFGAANIFRTVFKEQLPHGKTDADFSLSLFTFSKDSNLSDNPVLPPVDLKAVLVGLGAIGNGCIWALSKLEDLSGNISLIDHETISLSNLQRYVLTSQDDIGKNKVDLAAGFFAERESIPDKQKKEWQEFIAEQKNTTPGLVAVCVDSGIDRINVQGSLPKKIYNAWTQNGGLGVSRHLDFVNSTCLACLYLPEHKTKSRSELLAETLGIPEQEKLVRSYLANNTPLDAGMMNLVATANNIGLEKLQPYEGKPLDIFRSEFVCGGVLMSLVPGAKQQDKALEVPSAFESAFAGILLAAELVIDAANLPRSLNKNMARFNLMRPLTEYIQDHSEKHVSGRCICQDPIYQKVYTEKWKAGNEGNRDPSPPLSKVSLTV